MSKRIFALFTALIIAVISFGTSTAYGQMTYGVVVDERNVFTSDEETELNQLLQSTSLKIDMNVAVLIVDVIRTDEQQTCDEFLNTYFGSDSDSIMLMIAEEGTGYSDWVSYTNRARTVFKPQLDHIFDAVYYGLDSGSSTNYYAAVEQFCSYLVKNKDGYVGDVTGGISYQTCLEDYQNALSSSEKSELLGEMQSTADKIGANIGVVLTNGIGSGNERQYTDDFLDDRFGYDSSSIVLMLVRAGTGEQDWISCSNHANDIYGSRTDRIFDAVYDGLDSGGGDNYPAAIRKFCTYLEDHPLAYSGDSSLDDGISFHVSMGNLIGVGIALAIALMVVNGMAAGYKKKNPVSARAYIESNMTKFTMRRDMFIREYTTSHRVSSSSSGGSHGGGHSGGGGHSRSGGHGGGGGRHR